MKHPTVSRRKLRFYEKEKIMETKFKQSKLKGALVSAVLVGTASLTLPAYAGTDTSNMAVTADIGMNCTIATTDIAFGSYDPIVANATSSLTANGTVTTTCTVGSTGVVIIGEGLDPTSDSSPAEPDRRMGGPSEGDYLAYQVYSDSERANVWTGDGETGVAYIASGSGQVMTVYGEVAAGQTDAVEGSYSDTLVVTVNY